MKKSLLLLLIIMPVLAACSQPAAPLVPASEPSCLIYGSGDYTRVNPAIDEHGEINALIFDGLTDRDAENDLRPGLAESWDYDEDNYTYTFHLRSDIQWHDGEAFTAEDVKFTLDAIRDPANESEIAANFADIESIAAPDQSTVVISLIGPNAAFLDYMTVAILPSHCLAGQDMQESAFFRAPIGTGPYRLTHWDQGQSITLERNEDYFRGAPHIETIIFKIVDDDNAQALQLQTNELDLALIPPALAANFRDTPGYTVYNMRTADYRGILYNFDHPFWQENRELIAAFNYAFDRRAMVDTILLGQGVPAYGPLQMSPYDEDDVERYAYDPVRCRQLIQGLGWTLAEDGFYYRDGEKLGFELSVRENEQERIDLAAIASQQLKEVGVDCRVRIASSIDWGGQMAFLIGWGSPFDPDDHTWKVFGTDQAANFSAYSNPQVDEYLTAARSTFDQGERTHWYSLFQKELAADPPYSFLVYLEADYVASRPISGVSTDTVLGHHGVGLFWNVEEWQLL